MKLDLILQGMILIAILCFFIIIMIIIVLLCF